MVTTIFPHHLSLAAVILLVCNLSGSQAFTDTAIRISPVISGLSSDFIRPSFRSSRSSLNIKPEWFAEDDENHEDDPELITREMFQRELLKDPQVRKKNGKYRKGSSDSGYKPLDNRDHLPFVVKKTTPDPYTHPEKKAAKAKRVKTKKSDLDQQMASSKLLLTSSGKKGDTSTTLGEFKLDKSTTSGDVIILGDREFEVQRARCQYKYAGGQVSGC